MAEQPIYEKDWTYNAAMDNYRGPGGQEISQREYQARVMIGQAPPALSRLENAPRSIPMVPLHKVLDTLAEVYQSYYHESPDVARFTGHATEKLRALVNVHDPKELLR